MGMSRRVGVIPAAVASLALVLGSLPAVPPESASQLADRAANAAVQVESIVLTALDAAVASIAVEPVSAATQTDQQSMPAAAAAADIGTTIGKVALTVVGLAIAPVWYLAFPITLPVAIVATFSALGVNPNPLPVPDMGITAMLQAIALVFGFSNWLSFPLALPSLVFPNPPSDTAVAEPAAARTGASADVETDEPAQQPADPAHIGGVPTIEAESGSPAPRPRDRRHSRKTAPAVAHPSAATPAVVDAPTSSENFTAPDAAADVSGSTAEDTPPTQPGPAASKGTASIKSVPRGTNTAARR